MGEHVINLSTNDQNKNAILVVPGKHLNSLRKVWPSRLAIECYGLFRKTVESGCSFSEKNQTILQKVLEDSHPYYKKLFSLQSEVEKRDYLCSFFSGACGFYFFTHHDEKIEADENKLREYFGEKDYTIFQECQLEDTLQKASGLGDVVVTFRMIQLLLRTIIKTDLYGGKPILGEQTKKSADEEQEEETGGVKTSKEDIPEEERFIKAQKRLYEAIQLYNLIYETDIFDAGYELKSYNQYSLTKDLAENPTLFFRFLECGEKLDTPPDEDITVDSLYEAVKWEIQWIAHLMDIHTPKSKKLILRQCQFCGDFYIYSNSRHPDYEKNYCSFSCSFKREQYARLFYICGEAIHKRPSKSTQDKLRKESLKQIFMDSDNLNKINMMLKSQDVPEQYFTTAYIILLSAIYYKVETGTTITYPNQNNIENLFNRNTEYRFQEFCPGDWKKIYDCLFLCKNEDDVKSYIETECRNLPHSERPDLSLMEEAVSYYRKKIPHKFAHKLIEKDLCEWEI